MSRWLTVVIAAFSLSCSRGTDSSKPPPTLPPGQKGECDEVTETNLDELVGCYYRAKRGPSLWRFLSSAAKADQTDDVGWAKVDHSDYEISDVRVTKQESMAGSTFAAVSVSGRRSQADGGFGCSTTQTQTWVRQEQMWRRHGGYKTVAEVTAKKYWSGDYSGAAESAEEWLKIDPFSVEAYEILGGAVSRGAKGKNKDDVLRAVMAIDPKNSTALFLAVSKTDDADVAENYLRQFKPDDCGLGGAVENVAFSMINAGRPSDALKVLDQHPDPDGLGFLLPRILALPRLRRAKEVPRLLTEPVLAGIRRRLDSSDPYFAASWAGNIAAALIDAGEKEKAREWIDYGLLNTTTSDRLAAAVDETRSGRG